MLANPVSRHLRMSLTGGNDLQLQICYHTAFAPASFDLRANCAIIVFASPPTGPPPVVKLREALPGQRMIGLFAIAVVAVFSLAGLLMWLYRGLLMSFVVRLLASLLPNAAKRHGLAIRFGLRRGVWIRLGLQANLGRTLSQVVGRPVQAVAYGRFGGFKRSRLYSDFMNPDSPHYQAWLGAYVVFDDEERRAFGFDDQGDFVPEEVLAVLEADQRLVYRSAGCPERFPDGYTVRLRGELEGERREVDGQQWWRIAGEADTWSAYHRGGGQGDRLRSRVYGTVPRGAGHDVDDFHPLRYRGEFWMRYFPEYQGTCARFYIYPYYEDREGREVTRGEQIVSECQELLKGITFSKG
jgi:hypothetical protein